MINKTNSLENIALSTEDDPLSINFEDTEHNSYFKGGHWGQCLELLQHLCQYSENIVLVMGDSGIGKTTLKQALLEATSNIFKCCDLNAETYHDISDLMDDVAVGFGISMNNSKLGLAENIASLTAHDDKIWVLLIDNAHLLATDTLHALIKLLYVVNKTKVNRNSQFRLVLLGLGGLEEKVEAAKLQVGKEENTHVLELEPLTLSEVELYLLYKWRLAGNKSVFPFDNATIKKIHQLSAGNPRKIERLARDQLAGIKLVSKDKKNNYNYLPKISFTPILKSGLIIGCLSAGAIFLLKPLFISSTATTLVKIEMPAEKNKELQRLQNEQAESSKMAEIQHKPVEVIKVPLSTDLQEKEHSISSNTIIVGKEEVLPRVIELEQLAKQNLAQIEKDKAQANITLPHSEEQQEKAPEVIINDTVTIIDKPESAVVQSPPVIAPEKEHQAHKPIMKAVTEKKVVANNKTVKNNYNKYEQKILQIPSTHYTLQLLGASKVAGIEQFITNNKLQNQAYYYRTMYKNQPWYILVFGNYPTRIQAKAAVTNLPAPVRALHPWVRDFASIKKTLQTRN